MNFIINLSKNRVYKSIYNVILNVIEIFFKNVSLHFILKKHDHKRSCRNLYAEDSLFI